MSLSSFVGVNEGKRMKRRLIGIARAFVTVMVIAVIVLLALTLLTEPEPVKLLTDHGRWLAILPRWSGKAVVGGAGADVRRKSRPPALFSDDWFDDSGFSFTASFSVPVTDPTSLGSVRAALDGRAGRGIAQLQAQLDRIGPGTPDALVHSTRLNLLIGSLMMFEGRFEEAAGRYEAVLRDEPTGEPLLRANLEMLIGVAALRRGETENCVACRNEASCIFPLAPEAVHLKPAGSREAIRRFTSYLNARPDDLGVRWLLNIAYMTLAEYPDKVPPKFLIPLEPFRSKVSA